MCNRQDWRRRWSGMYPCPDRRRRQRPSNSRPAGRSASPAGSVAGNLSRGGRVADPVWMPTASAARPGRRSGLPPSRIVLPGAIACFAGTGRCLARSAAPIALTTPTGTTISCRQSAWLAACINRTCAVLAAGSRLAFIISTTPRVVALRDANAWVSTAPTRRLSASALTRPLPRPCVRFVMGPRTPTRG
jgi:hypothetical protein